MLCLRVALADPLTSPDDTDNDKEQQLLYFPSASSTGLAEAGSCHDKEQKLLYSPSASSPGLAAASSSQHALALPGAGFLMLWGEDLSQVHRRDGPMPLPEPDLADAPPAYAELRFT